MTIAMSTTRERYPLSTKKIIKKTITSILPLVIILGFFVGFFVFYAAMLASRAAPNYATTIMIGLLVGALVGLLVLLFLSYLYQRWYFNVYFYDFTSDYVIIRKGPITPREITIPYERIQDVYVDQDLFDRMFGLYDVHLSSATASSGMEAHVDGLEKQAADGLRAMLLKTVSEKLGRKVAAPAASVPTPVPTPPKQ